MSLSSGFELERVQRAAILTLLPTINAEIIASTSFWAERDKNYAATLGIKFTPVKIERIRPENMHAGTKPSLIDAEMDQIPNIVAMADRAVPLVGQGTDHSEAYSESLWIEIMVKGDETEETIVNSRIQRTMEAVHNVLMMDRTLNRTVESIGDAPSLTISDQFAGTGRKTSKKYVWQGGRLEYSIRKDAPMYQKPGSVTMGQLLGVDQID